MYSMGLSRLESHIIALDVIQANMHGVVYIYGTFQYAGWYLCPVGSSFLAGRAAGCLRGQRSPMLQP